MQSGPGPATGTAERFYERERTPVLTDIELDFGGLAVEGLYPSQVPDPSGGRLWQTALSIMTLEAYYRRLTIYAL